MKKLTILIAMLMATSAWAEWTYFIESFKDDVTYVNYDTLQRDGNRLFVWTMTNYATRQSSGTQSVVDYQEIDCGIPRRSRSLDRVFRDKAMGEGKDLFLGKKSEPEWLYFQPGAVAFYVMDVLCDSTEPKSNSD